MRQQLLELRVAHHLRVVLQRVCDLLFLRLREDGALVGQPREREGQGREHDRAGEREPEREAEGAGRRVDAGRLAHALVGDR